MSIFKKHQKIEKHATLLMVLALITVMIGGTIQIVPLFYLENTIEKVDGMRPYTPLELEGRNIYVREGCYNCHSQMIRPMRDEVTRYGHYSLAAESMYDRPFQWGSKRTGPDLARVGGRYSDDWHQDHFMDAKSVVPESLMPPYGFLADRPLYTKLAEANLKTSALVGTPYTAEMIANAEADMIAQATGEDAEGLEERYGKEAFGTAVNARNFDGRPELTEMDALIAYIQVLGTMVDFSTFTPDPLR